MLQYLYVIILFILESVCGNLLIAKLFGIYAIVLFPWLANYYQEINNTTTIYLIFIVEFLIDVRDMLI